MPVNIYKIESPSKRVYIGQTKDFKKRLYNYKCLDCKNQHILYNSLLKYGFDNHIITIIEELDDNVNQELVNILERKYIKIYKDKKLSMNIADGGKGGLISEETRSKLRNAQLGRKYSIESRRKMSISQKGNSNRKGKKASKETIKKISDSKKGTAIKGKLVIDTKTNKKYKSIAEAARDLNIKRRTLNAMLNGQNKNKTNLIYGNN